MQPSRVTQSPPLVACLGEALIDFVSLEAGVTVSDAPGFVKAAGGAPANVAVGVARLGGRAAFLGKVGADPFGRHIRDVLTQSGVDTSGLMLDPESRTGLAFVSIQADGERDFAFWRNPSADMLHRPDELPTALLAECDAYHFGSISLIQEPSRSATLQAAAIARGAGALISFDPNLRPALWPDLATARGAMLDAIPYCDVLKVSQEEGEFLTGASSVSAMLDALLGLGVRRLVAVTMGADGCAWRATDGAGGRATPPTVTPVDTTGAGDGFVAGMLVRLAAARHSDWPSSELAGVFAFANAVGALATTGKGAIPALPSLADVNELMAAPRPR
ncbi:MAG: PfkB family carbohydrate kinase [Armatimonadetes bacterium]|nr:PfkB family carbohydrate kinase [Armatimonadota bacterium]